MAPKLNVHRGAEINARLLPWASDDHAPGGRAGDSVGNVVAHFEAAGADARANRREEGAPVEPFSQPLDRRVHNPRHEPPPTRVDGGCVAVRLVRHKHGHAVGDTHAGGARAVGGSYNDGVGLSLGVAFQRLKGDRPVHLFGPRDAASIRKFQCRGESAVADSPLGESVTEPGPDEKRGLQEDHADR